MGSRTVEVREHVRVSRGGLPRPSALLPGAACPRPGTPRPESGGGCSASPSGRPECNWWGAARHQATAAGTPRRQRSRPPARVPTGKANRELVRRALSPPAARGVLRRRSFRPAPSRLRYASAPSPASPRPRPS